MSRVKGSKNKHSFNAELLAQKFDVEPLEILMWIATGDWKSLGFEHQNKVIIGEKNGIEFSIEEPNIKIEQRARAAEAACKYLYSTKQAVAISNDGDAGFKISVVDYTKDKK